MIDLSHLLCAIGGHVAETGATWNHGYAFSRCRRCEREIIRPLFGRWRLPPPGCRVVWRRAAPPASVGRSAHVSGAPPETDFMDDEGADFRWTADDAPPDSQTIPEPYDFMREEPLHPPRAQRLR